MWSTTTSSSCLVHVNLTNMSTVLSCRLNGESAHLISQYLVSQRPVSLNFDVYLRQVIKLAPSNGIYTLCKFISVQNFECSLIFDYSVYTPDLSVLFPYS